MPWSIVAMAIMRENVNVIETASQGIKRLLFCGLGVVEMGGASWGSLHFPFARARMAQDDVFELAAESRTLC